MNKSRHRGKTGFIERVSGKVVFLQFGRIWNALTPDGISRLLDEIEIIGAYFHGVSPEDRLKSFRINGKTVGQLFQTGDA